MHISWKNEAILKSSSISVRVVIRGDLQDDAVLCTEKETFNLKLAETSNTMLLTPNTCLPETPGMVWYRLRSLCVGWKSGT